MDFGVQEVLGINSKSNAPGWAYVPVNTNKAAGPSSRKRTRNDLPSNQQDTTAKQDAKILRELAQLDRENPREANIPVPIRHRDNAGRVSHGKVTPGVRKILLSQKTFANHLSDFEALSAQSGSQPTLPPPPMARVTGKPAPVEGRRSHKKKDPNAPPTPLRQSMKLEDTPMIDAHTLTLKEVPDPPAHPRDNDPLLVSRIPAMPSQEELERLLAMPPLSYNEAKGAWVEEDRRKPVRTFCEICGYWGRVKCMRCGGRVCALECLTTHQEECFTRYGA